MKRPILILFFVLAVLVTSFLFFCSCDTGNDKADSAPTSTTAEGLSAAPTSTTAEGLSAAPTSTTAEGLSAAPTSTTAEGLSAAPTSTTAEGLSATLKLHRRVPPLKLHLMLKRKPTLLMKILWSRNMDLLN